MTIRMLYLACQPHPQPLPNGRGAVGHPLLPPFGTLYDYVAAPLPIGEGLGVGLTRDGVQHADSH